MHMSQRDIQFSKLNVLKVTTERFVTVKDLLTQSAL